MIEDNRLLTEAEAQQISEKFLLAKYYESKINFTDCQLLDKGDIQTYQLRGKITMRSQSTLDRFVASKSANQYAFELEIDSKQGKVINYEII
ncbi:MAG: hypothetical protein JXB43_03045 [Dehalococcoidia bacterium]|nr:hypothetical protein [Dehalococcoidia bacterium]